VRGVVVFPQGQGLKAEEYGDHCGEQLRRAFVIRTREMERVVTVETQHSISGWDPELVAGGGDTVHPPRQLTCRRETTSLALPASATRNAVLCCGRCTPRLHPPCE
jgi:hypothetical protein